MIKRGSLTLLAAFALTACGQSDKPEVRLIVAEAALKRCDRPMPLDGGVYNTSRAEFGWAVDRKSLADCADRHEELASAFKRSKGLGVR